MCTDLIKLQVRLREAAVLNICDVCYKILNLSLRIAIHYFTLTFTIVVQ